MKNQKKIYVIGHKNPDTDSICSALAYADIKNRINQNKQYVPKRVGELNKETEFVLKYFGVEAPDCVLNIGTQVKDMDIRVTPDADKEMSVKRVWDLMRSNNIVTLPVCDRERKLEGLLTIGDIARTYMETTDSYLLSRAGTKYNSIAETIDGQVVEGCKDAEFTVGKVLIGNANPKRQIIYVEEHDLLIMGDREEDQLEMLKQKLSCMIVGLGAEVSQKVKQAAKEQGTTIISSPLDSFTIARLINQSIPVKYIMKTENLVTFCTDDYTDEIKEIMVKHRNRAFPVLNKSGKCVGTISRRNFLDMRKKKVVLIDHNEKDQSVDNIEKADILEIVDHHSLGSIRTNKPIRFRNEPMGCTATIIYQMYTEQHMEISPQIAGLLCAAILSDTLMFRSPTCTLQDKMAAGALALIADIEIDKFAKEMFRAGSNLKDMSAEELFYHDYKRFSTEGNVTFGVGQIMSMDEEELQEIKKRLQPFIETKFNYHGVGYVYFMLTNIIEQSTELLCYGAGSEEIAENAFHQKLKGNAVFLQGVVSRKKQVTPVLLDAMAFTESFLAQ